MAPERFENWFNLGVAYHKMCNFLKAAQAYEQATKIKADSAQAFLNLAVAQQELSDLAGGRASYEKHGARPESARRNLEPCVVLEQQGERDRRSLANGNVSGGRNRFFR